MKKVIVVGGGISGLTTAWLLRDAVKSQGLSVTIRLLEQAHVTGGKIKSTDENGFVCEWGPNGFLDSKPQTLDLCRAMGIDNALMRSNDKARKRFVFSNGSLHQLPHDAISFVGSNLLSLGGKIRLMAEPFAKTAPVGDESLAAFGRRRLGDEALRKLIAPMASGIFAGDPEQMSLRSCFPRIAELEAQYGGLIKAMIALAGKKRKEKHVGKVSSSAAGPGGVLTSFRPGIQYLSDMLAEQLGSIVETGVTIVNARQGEDGWVLVDDGGQKYDADIVVFAVPAYEAARILTAVDATIAAILASIPYSPLKVVCFGYESIGLEHDLDGFGYLVPKEEKRTVLGTLWDSSMFENRAPEGRVLVRSMVGGACRPELAHLSPQEIERLVALDLKEIMGITKSPCFVKVIDHPQAIPHYTIGHGERVQRIAERLAVLPNLHLTGNAFKGVGINDCVAASQEMVHRVCSSLTKL